jgi:opacity protein-like surface antigen
MIWAGMMCDGSSGMNARFVALSLAPLFASSLARAQAPGEYVPPPPAPVAVPRDVGCGWGCSIAEPVMARRWALGLSLGSMGIAPEGQPDNATRFTIAELALRFRVTPHLELDLAVGGGRERTVDGADGDREVGQGMLALRYRFQSEAQWNWFVMGGIGGAAVTRHDATDQERDDAMQPAAMLGIGIERRFHSFALQAELRAIGFGERKRNDAVPPMPVEPAMSTPTPVLPAEVVTSSEKRNGGTLTIGVAYYF